MEVSYVKEICMGNPSDDVIEAALDGIKNINPCLVILGQGYGIEDAKMIKINFNHCEIILVSQKEEDAFEAWQLGACGFFNNTYEKNELQRAIKIARCMLNVQEGHNVIIRTMPTFDIFIDGNVMHWKSEKAKEILALAVDRMGGTVTTSDIVTNVWPDRPWDAESQNLASKARRKLVLELEESGIKDIILMTRKTLAINKDNVFCDYYEVLKDTKNINSHYTGSYMREYDWAEETNARLEFACSRN